MTRTTPPRRWPTLAAAGLLLALAGGGAGAYELGWIDHWRGATAPVRTVAAPAIDAPTPGPAVVAEESSAAPLDRPAVRAALAPRLRDERLGGRVSARVAPIGGPVGRTAFAQGDHLATPASTTKVITSAAVLRLLGPDHTFTTSVSVQDDTVTLVGGGDPLLSTDDVRSLARTTAAELEATGVRSVSVRFDNSLFDGPSVSPRWRSDYVPDEVVAPISALSIDRSHTAGDDGELHTSDDGRQGAPAKHAAQVFGAELRAAGIAVPGGVARGKAAGETVAELDSAPLGSLVEYVLQHSDNEGAEILARHVGLAAGDPSFDGSMAAVAEQVEALGVPASEVRLVDGSGLSRDDLLAADALARVLQAATSPDHPELAPVLTGLPTAGFSGTGRDRFVLDAEGGRGYARLKSGTLTGVHSYAGLVTDRNGTPMVVVLMADRVPDDGSLDARDALDDAVAALATCDCS